MSVISNSLWPHRRQPTRLPRPRDSPGKNTGVGCHLLLQCMKMKSESEVAQSCPTLSDPMDCSPPGSSVHWIFQARVLECVAIAFCDIYGQVILIQQSKCNKWMDRGRKAANWTRLSVRETSWMRGHTWISF